MALPDRVFAQASPKSIGGQSLFDANRSRISSFSVSAFTSAPGVVSSATSQLRQAGFEILQVSPFTINIAGPPALFKSAFKTDLEEREVKLANANTSTHLHSPQSQTLGLIATKSTAFESMIEGVALEVPRAFFQGPSVVPPPVSYWHLTVPAGVAEAINATPLHLCGITGA